MSKINSDELVKKLTEMIDIIKKNDESEIVEQTQIESKCPMGGCPLKKMMLENKQNIVCPLKDCKKGVYVIRIDLDQDRVIDEEDNIDFNVDSDTIEDDQIETHKAHQQDWIGHTLKSCMVSSLILMLFILIFVNIFKIIRTFAM